MFGFDDDKERKRYYLLAGMGGKGYRRKQKRILKYALVVALAVSVVMAVVLYSVNGPGK